MLKHSNSLDFKKDVIDNTKVVLVDFYAQWCGPCKMIAPILESIASSYNEFDIVKINIDENEEVAYQYEIRSIPTLKIFKNGNIVDEIIGFTDKETILNAIKKQI